jgi:hypothetical protein
VNEPCGHANYSPFWEESATCQRPAEHEHDHMQARPNGRYWTWNSTDPYLKPTNALQAEADMAGIPWRDNLEADDWHIDDEQLDQARDQWQDEAEAA